MSGSWVKQIVTVCRECLAVIDREHATTDSGYGEGVTTTYSICRGCKAKIGAGTGK